MENNKLENLISSLSENEKEQFKDLIEECKQREKDIISYSERTKQNIQILANVLTRVVKDLNDISINVNKTNKTLQKVKQEQQKKEEISFLENLPDDKFFKA